MLHAVDFRALFNGKRAPQNEHKMLTVFAQVGNHRIGELFPTTALMRTSLVRLNSEGGVEHQHALLCPASEIAACGNGCSCIGVDFLENVLQRWWKRHTVVHR